MKTKLLAMIGAIAAIGFASYASAQTYTATYTGTVVGSGGQDVDVEDLFGGGNLNGDTFTAVYTYGTALGSTEVKTGTSDEIYGGTDYYNYSTNVATPSPILSATFTINGDSYTYTPDYDSIANAASGSKGLEEDQAYSSVGDVSLMKLSSTAAPALLTTPFSGTSTAGTTGNYLDTAFDSNGNDDVIGFTTKTVTIAAVAVSAAPEPSTWALMMLGVGMMGLGLRRRRHYGLANAFVA